MSQTTQGHELVQERLRIDHSVWVDFTGLLALVAQWIEQEPSNLLVAGSIPAEGTTRVGVISDPNHESERTLER